MHPISYFAFLLFDVAPTGAIDRGVVLIVCGLLRSSPMVGPDWMPATFAARLPQIIAKPNSGADPFALRQKLSTHTNQPHERCIQPQNQTRPRSRRDHILTVGESASTPLVTSGSDMIQEVDSVERR